MASEKKPTYFHNWISLVGGMGAVITFAAILVLIIIEFLDSSANIYLEGFTYLLLPGFLIVFLLMIPLGAIRERRRRVKSASIKPFPVIDFNNPAHQRFAFVTIAVFTVFVLFSMFGTYKAYEFSESTEFCGTTCHTVMTPEYTAYSNSPHARVGCVECHIGSGADWYVRSKISGARQIIATLRDDFSRPIETPVHNLRPAQETCAQCHWPEQFFGAVEQDHTYFLPDEENTKWHNRMLIHVGGGKAPAGRGRGIHWHMNINNKIYYVPADEKRQDIPWVKQVDASGKETIFVHEESEFSASNPPEGEMRLMDCVDCHNRPSHIYKAPVRAVNEALASDQIDASIPYIKKEAVEALTGDYTTAEDAASKIRTRLEGFYEKKYPDFMKLGKDKIAAAIDQVIKIYNNNFFPEMNVAWKVYPDNIGHMNFDGCFRCHDGLHKSAEGRVISKDCNACHTIITQGPAGDPESAVEGLEFKHPEDIEGMWQEMKCTDCHDGSLA